MLKIRLARVGKRKKPAYRFIVNESARDTYGKALEILGHYNPFSKVIEVKKDRIDYWISKGAQMSPTVHNLLVDQNVIKADKVTASKAKKKKKGGDEEAAPAAEGEAKPEGEVTEAPASDAPAEEKPAEEKPAEEKPAEEAPAETPAPAAEKKEEPKPEEKKEEAPTETPVEEKKGETK